MGFILPKIDNSSSAPAGYDFLVHLHFFLISLQHGENWTLKAASTVGFGESFLWSCVLIRSIGKLGPF